MPAAGKSNGKGEGSGASGSAAISPGSPPPDLRYNWTCSNCSDGAAVRCTGKQPCRLCGQRAPEWVHKGLTQNEELLRKAKAFGNRTDGIELSIERERQAAKRREAAAAGNSCSGKGAGDVRASPAYRALQAKLDQRDAEFAKLKKEAAGGSAAAGVAPEVDAPGADPAGAGEADMEVDTHKTHQAAAREAEESVQEWQALLDPLVKKTFPDGTADEQALQQSDATGGVYRKLLEARAARDAARERVRDSRPLAGQIALKRKGLSKTEGQIAANQQKADDLGKTAEELQKSLDEVLQQQSAVLETTRGQQARFKLQSEELAELRRQELEAEGVAVAPPPPAPPPAADHEQLDSAVLRGQGDPAFLRELLEKLLADPGCRVTARRALDLKEAALDEQAKADGARAAEEAAQLAATRKAAEQARSAADRAAAASAAAGLPRGPRDLTGAGGRGRACSVGAASERSRSRGSEVGGKGKKDEEKVR